MEGEFAAAMAALAPFEAQPVLGVAVSGGADSMALCLLADAWAQARGGKVLALIVDHRLRSSSAEEARWTACRLAARGIDSEILVWSGNKPVSAIHAKAREARYRLLADRCRERGVLHLLVGHHLDDQAETMLLRAARRSGAAGLAGMTSLVKTGAVRVLRPLLGVPKQRLRAYLLTRGQAWLEDPSNADPAFARTRVRSALASGAWVPGALAEAAGRHQTFRRRRDRAVAAFLARYCRLHPAGFVTLNSAMLRAQDKAAVEATLGRVAATVGGTARPPLAEKLSRLRRYLAAEAPGAASLGRCIWRFSPCAKEDGDKHRFFVVFREDRGLPPPIQVCSGTELEWDGRFLVRIGPIAGSSDSGFQLEALGERGWREALRLMPSLREGAVPQQAAHTLPVLREGLALLAVPGLNLYRRAAMEGLVRANFRPRRSLSGSGYYLA